MIIRALKLLGGLIVGLAAGLVWFSLTPLPAALFGFALPIVTTVAVWLVTRRRPLAAVPAPIADGEAEEPATADDHSAEHGIAAALRSRLSEQTVLKPAEVQPALSPQMPTFQPVDKLKARMRWSVIILVGLIASLFGWSYLSSMALDDRILMRLMQSNAERLFGEHYIVDSISFPNGTSSFEYPVAVVVTDKETAKKDLFAMRVRGDCDEGCMIGIDPADAFRVRR